MDSMHAQMRTALSEHFFRCQLSRSTFNIDLTNKPVHGQLSETPVLPQESDICLMHPHVKVSHCPSPTVSKT